MARGRLITVEGVDGAGKSTLAGALVTALAERGLRVELRREPGGVEEAERIRALVVDPALDFTPRAEALLFAAARAQLAERVLEPLLAAGAWVVLDRFLDSSLAYQGAGRGLGTDAVAQVNRFGLGRLRPDRTLLLRVPPGLGRDRQGRRGAGADRLEREDEAFFARVVAGYEELLAAEPGRIRPVDAAREPAAVLAAALGELADLLP